MFSQRWLLKEGEERNILQIVLARREYYSARSITGSPKSLSALAYLVEVPDVRSSFWWVQIEVGNCVKQKDWDSHQYYDVVKKSPIRSNQSNSDEDLQINEIEILKRIRSPVYRVSQVSESCSIKCK